jgi:archaellum component FlaC
MQDMKPRRVWCVDEASANAADALHPRIPFAFAITPRNCKYDLLLAADTADDRARWMTAIANADYGKMYMRTRDAVVFLTKCTRAVAPFAADREGIAVPAMALSASGEANQDADEVPPGYEAFAALRGKLTGSDVLTVINAMQSEISTLRAHDHATASVGSTPKASVGAASRGGADPRNAVALEDAQAEISSLRNTITKLQDEREHLRKQLKQADEVLALPTADPAELDAAKSDVRKLQRDLDTARSNNKSLQSQVDTLNQQVSDLKRELSTATAAAARAARLMVQPSSSRPGTGSGSASGASSAAAAALEEEAAALRSRVREMEAQQQQMQAQQQQLQSQLASSRPSKSIDRSSSRSAMMADGPGGDSTPTRSERSDRHNGSGSVISPPQSTVLSVGASSVLPTSGSMYSMDVRGDVRGGAKGGSSSVGVGSPETLYEHEWMPFYAEAQRLERDGV